MHYSSLALELKRILSPTYLQRDIFLTALMTLPLGVSNFLIRVFAHSSAVSHYMVEIKISGGFLCLWGSFRRKEGEHIKGKASRAF